MAGLGHRRSCGGPSNRREPRGIRVGQEFGRGEAVHKVLVYVQLHVGDAIADLIDAVEARWILQHPCGAAQRAVAQTLAVRD